MMRFSFLLLAVLVACSSSEDEGCKSDSDCKGDRICEGGKCVSPSAGSGGSGSGGSGGSTPTGGANGCADQCKTPAGTCCAGPGVCAAVPPCIGNPCCSE